MTRIVSAPTAIDENKVKSRRIRSTISGVRSSSTERITDSNGAITRGSVVRPHGSQSSAPCPTAPYRNSRPSVAKQNTLGAKNEPAFTQ